MPEPVTPMDRGSQDVRLSHDRWEGLMTLIRTRLLVAIGATQNRSFLSGPTWTNIGITASFLIITACGEGLVLIAGGIDLSVGAAFLAGAMTAGALSSSGSSVGVSVLGGVGAGIGLGLANGLLISYAAMVATSLSAAISRTRR